MRERGTHASPGMSNGPCHGCGQKGHPKDSVCARCQRLLKEAMEARSEQRAEEERQQYGVYRFSSRAYGSNPGYYETNAGTKEREGMQRALAEMVGAIETPLVGDVWHVGKPALLHRGPLDGRNYSDDVVRITVDQAEAIAALDIAVRALQASAYAAGRTYGLNIMMRLRDGELAPVDYDKLIAGKVSERR